MYDDPTDSRDDLPPPRDEQTAEPAPEPVPEPAEAPRGATDSEAGGEVDANLPRADETPPAPDSVPTPADEPEGEPAPVASEAEPELEWEQAGEAPVGEARSEIEPEVEIPDELLVLPLRETVVYPFAVVPLAIGKERSLRLIDEVMRGSRLMALVAQKDLEVEEAGPDDCYRVGVIARVARMLRLPDGTMNVIVQGLDRITITEFTETEPLLRARVRRSPETVEDGVEIEARTRTAIDLFQRLVNLVQYLPDQLAMAVMNFEDPRQVIYLLAGNAQMDLEARQELLEMDSVRDKLDRVTAFLTRELEVLELGKKIQSEAQEEMGKVQREYILREQLKAIQKELGEESEEAATINELRDQIEQADMNDEARKEAQRELSRLEKIPSASPEYSVIRTYLELLISLPWNKSTGKPIDVAHARVVLDEDHYDLEKIKDRILEYLAVRRLKEDRQREAAEAAAAQAEADAASEDSSTPPPTPASERAVNREPILCFVGPPGVGKTSLGHSIARALGREFVRLSLGGVHDEAEIRGHRRTYIGAMPGRILQSLRRAGTNDPVFMLDEVDKLSSDWRGDPSSAMLEVLDPEQNFSFRDNYLDLPFDLSKVMFIATANVLDTVPGPVRDRMEVIELPGYTEDEKLEIARRYLLKRQLDANGLSAEQCEIAEDAIRTMIRDYTREAGVRNLERLIGAVC
ncbi:MAG: endopeptidase La, partial [Chloroflexota bacterium]|nr:endopeptidase La [Chloroflexota bacterium]